MHAAAQQPDLLLDRMEALADPVRLRLLRLLDRQELGVVELADIVQRPQSTVSRHLKVLADAGWVRSRREGTTHLYGVVLDELDPGARRLWEVAREQIEQWSAPRQDEVRMQQVLRQRDGGSQAFFAGAAGEWDRLREELYGRRFSTAALLALLPDHYVVADLGCGTGQLSAELAGQVQRVIAVDNSAEMLRAAKRRVAELANVELRRGDLESLPIEDGACDAALLVLALTYVERPAAAIGQMMRILKPGGRAVVLDLLPHDRADFRRRMGQVWMGFDGPEVAGMMSEAGAIDVRVRPLDPEPQGKGPALFVASGTAQDKTHKS